MRPPAGEQPDGYVVSHGDDGTYVVQNGYPKMAKTNERGGMVNISALTLKCYGPDDDYRDDPFWDTVDRPAT